MERIASMFFCLSLVIYHVLRLFKIKKSTCIKVHIVLGSISIFAMICELVLRIGQEGFVKYIGFNIIIPLTSSFKPIASYFRVGIIQ